MAQSDGSWADRIEAARQRGGFDMEDQLDACYEWGTCAVGEVLSEDGRVDVGGLIEDEIPKAMRGPGQRFGYAVESNDYDVALAALIEIRQVAESGGRIR